MTVDVPRLLDDLQRARDVARAERRRRQLVERAFWAMMNRYEEHTRWAEIRLQEFQRGTERRLREATDAVAALRFALDALGVTQRWAVRPLAQRVLALADVASATRMAREEIEAMQRFYDQRRWYDARGAPATVATVMAVMQERDEARGLLANALHYGLAECEHLRASLAAARVLP